MRKILISIGALVLSSMVSMSKAQETTEVWVVDYKGKPPFKRTLKRVPVSDVAQFDDAQDTVAVKVKKGNKPPFKRRTVHLPVADVAQFEAAEESAKTDFRGKPPFKRK
jgi:hypothetical protein